MPYSSLIVTYLYCIYCFTRQIKMPCFAGRMTHLHLPIATIITAARKVGID